MNTTELFALIDDWQRAAEDLETAIDEWLSAAEDLESCDPGQFELGRATQLRACADQLLKVLTIVGID